MAEVTVTILEEDSAVHSNGKLGKTGRLLEGRAENCQALTREVIYVRTQRQY
jgi:hypothetical protein